MINRFRTIEQIREHLNRLKDNGCFLSAHESELDLLMKEVDKKDNIAWVRSLNPRGAKYPCT